MTTETPKPNSIKSYYFYFIRKWLLCKCEFVVSMSHHQILRTLDTDKTSCDSDRCSALWSLEKHFVCLAVVDSVVIMALFLTFSFCINFAVWFTFTVQTVFMFCQVCYDVLEKTWPYQMSPGVPHLFTIWVLAPCQCCLWI